jgi:hypothetical protein
LYGDGFFREPWYLRRNKHLFSYEVPEFRILESEFQFSDSPDIGIQKKNPTGIFGIENGIGILLTMGVPEIGTKNWNSQLRLMVVVKKKINGNKKYTSNTGDFECHADTAVQCGAYRPMERICGFMRSH